MTPVAIGDIQRTQGTLKTVYNAKNRLRHLSCVYTWDPSFKHVYFGTPTNMGTLGPSYYLHWDPLTPAPPIRLITTCALCSPYIHWQAVGLRLKGFLVIQAISSVGNGLDHLHTICRIWTTTFLPRYLILKEVTIQLCWLHQTLLEPRLTLHCGIWLS